MDELTFREAMGQFPTGVTVVTALDGRGLPYGLTVNSFTSVSLEPPLVLVCVDRASNSHDALVHYGRFAVNVLAKDQAILANNFAVGPSRDRFRATDWKLGAAGLPLLEGTAAWCECKVEAVHRAGDHSILVGRVTGVGSSNREALVFHQGAYGVFAR